MDEFADEPKTSLPTDMLGMRTSVPRGLLRLAVDQQVPVVLYITGLNTSTGGRVLQIKPLGKSTTVEGLAEQVFGELTQLIAQDAPAWHYWGIADRFFVSP